MREICLLFKDPDAIKPLAEAFRSFGIRTIVTASAQTVIDEIDREKVDLVIFNPYHFENEEIFKLKTILKNMGKPAAFVAGAHQSWHGNYAHGGECYFELNIDPKTMICYLEEMRILPKAIPGTMV